MVEGIKCITLGHGLEDESIKHEYWGTKKVVNDIINHNKTDYEKNGRVSIF